MQYHLNGYRYGDPTIHEAAAGREGAQGPLPESVDVLIVGTGPAGTVLAAQLARFPEISTRVVERRQGPLPVGQADGVSCRTVEMFDAFGLAPTLLNEAYWVNETTFWSPAPGNRDEITRSGQIQDVADGLSEYPHVIVNQARMQELLLENASTSASRLEVDYGFKALGVEIPEEPDTPVTVTLEETDADGKGTGATRTIRARYVVGCDGARSVIRTSIGRSLHGDAQNHAWGVMDILPVTDFPDVRKKAVMQSASGSLLQIPREGGHLVRYYVDLGDLPEGDRSVRERTTFEDILSAAQKALHPYTLEARDVAWWSVYEVGQRVTDGFDDVSAAQAGRLDPRVFIAGDACHTHSAKAGQGMNVSMQDTYNLGWKLAAVLQGRSPNSLLATYSGERQKIAEELIEFDKRWSRMIGSKAADVAATDVESHFVAGGEFTAGLSTVYERSLLTGGTEHQGLATGFAVGSRFHSAPVIRVADAKPEQLGHVHEADGRWRLYAFGDAVDAGDPNSALRALMTFLDESPESPVRRFTPAGAPDDAVFDVRAIVQQGHRSVGLNALPPFLFPAKGRFGLRDYQKVFSAERTNGRLLGSVPGLEATQDIYDLRGIDRERGALVVVRPDQYVAQVMPLASHAELAEFFASFMLEQD
ncbi:FAD-dependent monooxygenase [Citricoccus sp. I39-566]|uniref:FAD-dependent monooxygenase n=1 Tax=Citricoccus sp. I39-566 TaxID=3073268 RepID=UPI00286BFCAC|nr:FAD-dependent monooxygenase [Citricoccus sp. I39-566]WMY77644.1 FAD-dependent monooxygenase [Citricoccus sp. I39-566]